MQAIVNTLEGKWTNGVILAENLAPDALNSVENYFGKTANGLLSQHEMEKKLAMARQNRLKLGFGAAA